MGTLRLALALVAGSVTLVSAQEVTSPPSPLDPEIMGHIERLIAEMWPGVLVIPTMSTGATDVKAVASER